MKKPISAKLLLLVVAVVMIFGATTVAYAINDSESYTISNLAPNGGVLWSIGTINKDIADNYGYCWATSFTQGQNFTCRIYLTDQTSKTMDYLLIQPTTPYKYAEFYKSPVNYYLTLWTGKMKFSNDTTVKTVSSGTWGASVSHQ